MTSSRRNGKPSTALPETELFTFSRAKEYLDPDELRTMTGQPPKRFPEVEIKELVDNGLDGAEKIGVAPDILIYLRRRGDLLVLSVRDNGSGMSQDVVAKVIDFNTRSSDKSHYRALTRGLQGNAEKTVIGIPRSLGVRKPVVIRTNDTNDGHGHRHAVSCDVDPAGEVQVRHLTREAECPRGTTVTLALPADACRETPFFRWATAFALFNPHARIKILESGVSGEACCPRGRKREFLPTVEFPDGPWRKFNRWKDRTSAWWYDDKALSKVVFGHVGVADHGGPDLSLFDLVSRFRGLSSPSRAREVCRQFPNIKAVTDFRGREREVGRLLGAMRGAAKAPNPTVLGFVGEAHFRTLLERQFGVRRLWYDKDAGTAGDIPFTVEVAIAETDRPGGLFHGINFSPTFDDPLGGTAIPHPKRKSDTGLVKSSYSLKDFLDFLNIQTDRAWRENVAVAFHLACPGLEYTDKGKTHLQVPQQIADATGALLWKTGKVLWKEDQRRQKDAAAQERYERRERAGQPRLSLTYMFSEVLREAYDHETDHERIRTTPRFLFYSASELIQQHFGVEVDRKKYNTFSQKILPVFRREKEPLPKVYYEPRGTLHEPHSGVALPLGDESVEDYRFPDHLYGTILFVEKEGSVWAIIEDAGLAERFDMAVITGKGYATEACRKLMEKADRDRHYKICVAHDGDPYGYNIGRILRAQTARMPGYHVEVIDLGLKVEDAIALGLRPETFTRKKALPKELVPLLNETELRAFTGRPAGKKSWIGERWELNIFGAAGLADWFERKLIENGVGAKIIPPADILNREFAEAVEADVRRAVEGEYSHKINDEIAQRVRALSRRISGCEDHLPAAVKSALQEDPSRRWLDVVREQAQRVAAQAKARRRRGG